MKKTFIFGLMAAALGFTACSSEDDAVLGEKTQKKGMVLNATVKQPAETRATIDDSSTTWQFAFAAGDKVSVTNSSYSGYYTFEKNSTKFASEDAEVSETPVTWYAYYPSEEINLTGQTGTLADVANKFALAGNTSEEVKGDNGLTIEMSAQVAIIKIDNQKGNIDIKVKVQDVGFVTGLTAKSNSASFTVGTSSTPTSFLNVTTIDTYYIAVPAGSPLDIYDGDELVKSTSSGLAAGKYYELTIADPNLLPGDFSVSSTKKVKFTKSNLYWDGSNFKFEANQTDYPTTWNASHVGHFYWTKTQAASYAETYSDGTITTTDVPFFAQSAGLTVEGTSDLYALSQSEWKYLFEQRQNYNSLRKFGVTVGSTNDCLILAPDDFSETLKTSYTLAEVNSLGLLCLPKAGMRNDASIGSFGTGYYWSSNSSSTVTDAYELRFDYSNGDANVTTHRDRGCSIRLVK